MEDAEKLLVSIQKQDPTFLKAEIHILYGDKLASPFYKDYESAIDQYEAAAAIESKNVECHIKLANLYELRRDFEQAIKIYKKILKHDPSNFQALMKIGLVYIRNNMKDKGLQNLKAAYKIDSENLDLKLKLADVYIKYGNIEIAQ